MTALNSPVAEYNARVAAGDLTDDPDQRQALEQLTNLFNDLNEYKPSTNWLLSGLFGAGKKRPKGLYIYGGVGRGKSMLMDLFFDLVPKKSKRRVHFHAFMQEVHEAIHAARSEGIADPIKPIAKDIAEKAHVLCFDEMQITDITDAMLVGRLFEHLFERGTVIVTTSNRHPDDLYKHGLNRHIFLPFIELIKEQLTVFNLDSETDYRQNRLSGRQVYFSPLGDDADHSMDRLWQEFVTGDAGKLIIPHKGRTLIWPQFLSGIARANFADLCGKPLGPGDYLAMVRHTRVLFLDHIPILSQDNANEAKRFVTLVDTLYEAGVQLIASADAPPEDLYAKGTGSFEFERTASRLREMQSDDWLIKERD